MNRGTSIRCSALREHNAAFCLTDTPHHKAPRWRTADWGYLRLHEGAADPWPRYGSRALHGWLDRLTQAWPADAPVYAYFNNDQNGAAIADSIAFAALARGAGLEVTRTPDQL